MRLFIILSFISTGLLGQSRTAATIGRNNSSVLPLSIGNTIVTFQPTETLTSTDLLRSNGYNPQMLYNSGKTYFMYQSRYQSNPFGQIRMMVYEENKGVDRPIALGEVLSGSDPHTIPTLGISTLGKVYGFQENLHNTPIEIYRQDGVDYGYLTHIPEKMGSDLAYISLLKNASDNNYFSWSRGGGTEYSAYVVKSTSELEGWGVQTRITQNISGANDGRHYETLPLNAQSTGYNFLMVSKRYDNGNTWPVEFLLKTTDGVVFKNHNETYSHNIGTDGLITEAILVSNYQYYSLGSESIQGCIPIAGVSQNGKFYCIKGDGSGTNWYFIYNNGMTWQTQLINIPGLLDGGDIGKDPQHGPFLYLIPFDEQNIEVWCRRNNGLYTHIYRYITHDRGITWDEIGDVTSNISDNIWGCFIPVNILSIPFNRNFMIAFTSITTGTSSGTNAVTTYIKKAALGTLQNDAGYVPSTASSLAHASGLFNYKITSANITQSSNNITQLTDLFGLRNATGVNNPQWNGTDAFTLNGTNNYFTISSTGLTSLSKITLIAVVRSNAVTAAMFTLSNNASADQFMSFGVSHASFNNTSYVSRKSTSTNTVVQYGQDIANDNNWHIVTIQGDGNAKFDLYIDGKRQRYFNNASASDQLTAIGKMLSGITVNSVRLGSLDISGTDAFYSIQLKEIAAYSDFLDFETRRSFEKKLSVDYSIAYVDQYQSLN